MADRDRGRDGGRGEPRGRHEGRFRGRPGGPRARGSERGWGRAQGPQRPPSEPLPGCDADGWGSSWVQIKYFRFAPTIFANMIAAASPGAKGGEAVTVRDPEGGVFGWGLWNPEARVPLRILAFAGRGEEGAPEPEPVDLDALLEERLRAAVALRRSLPGVADSGDAWRVVNSDGDGVSGLTVDRYDRTLAVEVHSLGIWQRLPRLLEVLHGELGTKGHRIAVDERIARLEGIRAGEHASTGPGKLKIEEWGIRYEVDFERGHKTGFFCDQRDNRRRLGEWISAMKPGARVLDLCSYAGGFALAAARLGGADEVVGVDLDEDAVAMAQRNANMNELGRTCRFVHSDAFTWARQMIDNGECFDVVVVDPPKFVAGRAKQDEGERKYQDLNCLAVQLARPGALYLTCSCSGLVDPLKFRELVTRGIHRTGRSLQILDETGAGLDHPVASRAPEGRYLKVIWGRVVD